MSPLVRAKYGARDNMHALLEWQGPVGDPPPELLGLTDRPGTSGPQEEWWPSVGCCPLDKWWALWWTLPDTTSERAGMVRSEVALWPIDEVGQIDDLIPVMHMLSGKDSIRTPSQAFLRTVCDAILNGDDRPSVVCGLDVWPGVIAAVWKKLWPSARQAFSARVALAPPQGGESITPPRLFGIPSGRIQQWYGHQLVSDQSLCTANNRASGYLSGCEDKHLAQILAVCPPCGTDIKILNGFSRAADRLAALEVVSNAGNAISLLRTLQMIAPERHQAAGLKQMAAVALSQQMPAASLADVLSLANLKEEALPKGAVSTFKVTTWVGHDLLKYSISESTQLIEKLRNGKAVQWWQDAVKAALAAVIGKAEKPWAAYVLQWLGRGECEDQLSPLLPVNSQTEEWLLEAASHVEMKGEDWRRLKSLTVSKEWSRLHARILVRTVSEQQALSMQLDFEGTVLPGLEYLVKSLPGSVVIDGYLARPEGVLLTLVAKRTVQEASLLSGLDVGQPEWRQLWVAHVKAGGIKWPPEINRTEISSRIIEVVLNGENVDDLIRPISEDIAEIVITHPQRRELWRVLSGQTKQVVLRSAAQRLLAQLQQGVSVPEPEHELATAIVALAEYSPLSPPALSAIFSWGVSLDESAALRLLRSVQGPDLVALSEPIGKAVANRNWKSVAKEIYSLSKVAKPDLRLAAVACRDLLPWWDQFCLSVHHEGVNPANNANHGCLERRLAEIGADLAPDRLDDIWERIGGRRKDLPGNGTPASRWQAAAKLASSGKLGGGLFVLVQELCDDFPHNHELKELSVLLSRSRTS